MLVSNEARAERMRSCWSSLIVGGWVVTGKNKGSRNSSEGESL